MLRKQAQAQTLMSFQIHKNGSAIDGINYPNVEAAFAAMGKAAQGGEVTAVDKFDQIVRRYTLDECRSARRSSNRA